MMTRSAYSPRPVTPNNRAEAGPDNSNIPCENTLDARDPSDGLFRIDRRVLKPRALPSATESSSTLLRAGPLEPRRWRRGVRVFEDRYRWANARSGDPEAAPRNLPAVRSLGGRCRHTAEVHGTAVFAESAALFPRLHPGTPGASGRGDWVRL